MNAAIVFLALAAPMAAGELYFPTDVAWEQVEPRSAGWDPAKLEAMLDFAGARRSSGVVILLDGKILAERNWDLGGASRKTADGRAIEDVASVQKSVASTLVGIAISKDLVSLDDTVAKHLGPGWSKASPDQEKRITLRHLVTMTSGLSDKLAFEAPAGEKWRYNTVAYQLTMRILAKASGLTPNALTQTWLTSRIGMRDTRWIERPALPGMLGLASTARDLARFGLMIQAGGKWRGETIADNPDYLRAMLDSSQQLNPAYGYLWWLNGKKVVRAGGNTAPALIPSAPQDVVAALGALGRKVYVSRSLGLVATRIGANAQERGEPDFDDEFWKLLMAAAPGPR